MSLDQVQICNSALIKIGSTPILSLDDGSKSANLCKNSFEYVKRIVLRWHPWNFAVKRVLSSPLATTPAFGYTYEHQIPADALRILAISPKDELEYRIEGKKILTDSDNLEIKYVKDVVDLTEIDMIAAEAIACYLAWHIAYSITDSNTVRDKMLGLFEGMMKKAKTVDAQEEPAAEMEANLWVDSREGHSRIPMRGDR